MNKKKNNARGITLIALVITIIVLVILVGVTISVSINTGLIGNSKNAVANYKNKQDKELQYLGKVEAMVDIMYSMEEVQAGVSTGESNKKYTSKNAQTGEIKTAYIPAGFTVSNIEGETAIDGGLVIYSNKSNDTQIEETAAEYMAKIKSGTEGYTVDTLQATYNQYVWIPVENPTDMYGKISEEEYYGKLYEFNTDGTTTHLNWYEEIEEVTDEELQETIEEYNTNLQMWIDRWNGWTDEEKALYNQEFFQPLYGITIESAEDFVKLFGEGPTKESLKYNEYSRSYMEPDYLTGYDISETSGSDIGGYNVDANGNKIITEDGIKAEFKKMINSVELYKGFYIGRYELTGTVDNPTIVKGANPLTADANYSVNSCLRWYGLYSMCEKLEAENEKVTTSMIWGSQWDQAVKMSIQDKDDFLTNLEKYGSLNFTNSGTKTSAYNIYDMSGNAGDWTLESTENGYRITRGGVTSEVTPPYTRDTVEPFICSILGHYGCRAQLYL